MLELNPLTVIKYATILETAVSRQAGLFKIDILFLNTTKTNAAEKYGY
jgi:hypothetical protein